MFLFCRTKIRTFAAEIKKSTIMTMSKNTLLNMLVLMMGCDAINHSDTAYAGVVCVGDFLQGNTTGAISKGQYIADIMRLMDYHALTLGNHEFDYGVPRMKDM